MAKEKRPCLNPDCNRLTVRGTCTRCRNEAKRARTYYVNSQGRMMLTKKERKRPSSDALDKRLPGSFESSQG
jgi:hypothetical protein